MKTAMMATEYDRSFYDVTEYIRFFWAHTSHGNHFT